MKLRTLTQWLFTLVVLLTASTVSATDVHVMISAGFYGVYSELSPTFERAGHRLVRRAAHRWVIRRRQFPPGSREARPQMS